MAEDAPAGLSWDSSQRHLLPRQPCDQELSAAEAGESYTPGADRLRIKTLTFSGAPSIVQSHLLLGFSETAHVPALPSGRFGSFCRLKGASLSQSRLPGGDTEEKLLLFLPFPGLSRRGHQGLEFPISVQKLFHYRSV